MQILESPRPAHDTSDGNPSAANRPGGARPRRRRFRVRGFASLLLALSLMTMCFSGGILFFTPRGRTANWTDWSLLGLDKDEWGALHINNAILFTAIASLHVLLNWSVLVRYIKTKAAAGLNMKWELALALVLAAACVAGPIYNVAPFRTIMAWNEEIKDYWEGRFQQAPTPHAEELTLAELAGSINLTVDQVASALEDEGFSEIEPGLTIGEIGRRRDAAPSAVFAVIKKRYPEAAEVGPGRGRGWGRGPQTELGCSDDPDQEHAAPSGDPSRGEASGGLGEEHRPGAGLGSGRGMGPGRGMGWGRGLGLGRDNESQHASTATDPPFKPD